MAIASSVTRLHARALCGLVGAFAFCVPCSPSAQTKSAPLDATALFKKCSGSVVTIQTPSGFGSGVLVDASGVIVTNLHVVKGEVKATVTLANNDVYDDVAVVEADPRKDLVLLKIKGFNLPALELGDSETLLVGQPVYAIGAPRGLELTLSEGIVSGMRDSGEGYRVIQTTAAISPGSSGGGLFNQHGQLVGITTFRVKGGENLNFAVPINYVRGLLSTEAKYSLADLKQRSDDRSGHEGSDHSAATTSQPVDSIPTLARVYAATNGNLVVFEQHGGEVKATWSTSEGYVYGRSAFTWNPTQLAFVGQGTIKAVCGTYDTRVTDAPITEEIYVVSDRVIRNRWSNPDKLNCSKGLVTSYSWQEYLWYVPTQ